MLGQCDNMLVVENWLIYVVVDLVDLVVDVEMNWVILLIEGICLVCVQMNVLVGFYVLVVM